MSVKKNGNRRLTFLQEIFIRVALLSSSNKFILSTKSQEPFWSEKKLYKTASVGHDVEQLHTKSVAVVMGEMH